MKKRTPKAASQPQTEVSKTPPVTFSDPTLTDPNIAAIAASMFSEADSLEVVMVGKSMFGVNVTTGANRVFFKVPK